MKKIKLTQGKYALVDDEDFEKVNQYKWCTRYNRGGYWSASRRKANSKQPTQRMHRFIMNCPKGLEVDHINHNGLDNRKCNLRICTHKENMMNQKLRRATSSKYKGVSWHKQHKKWLSRIIFNGKSIHLGYYTNEITAALTYNIKAHELFGEYAHLNFKGE